VSDLGSDLKEDKVVELRPSRDLSDDDGWADHETDSAPAVDTYDDQSDQRTAKGVDEDGDGWGDHPTDLVQAELPQEPENVPDDAPIAQADQGPEDASEANDVGSAEAEDLLVHLPQDISDTRSPDQVPELDASRDMVEAAYEQQESRQPEFADVAYEKPSDDDALGFAADEHVSQVIEVEMPDGEPAYLKPAAGEDPDAAGRGDITPAGTGWKREVAACEVDRMLGLEVVPETVAVNDAIDGPASLQENAPYDALDPHDQYLPEDFDRMAVLDYVTANTDRHESNCRTQIDGRPAAIDNGYSFPTSSDVPIKSGFVSDRIDSPLNAEVLRQVRSADARKLRDTLQELGIEASAVEGCVERLQEVQREGRITGEAWGGGFVDGRGNPPRR